MLLTPKRRKFRKQHVKAIKGKSARGNTVAFGKYGLKAISSDYITNRQLEATRKVIVRYIRKVGKLWVRVFPDVPLTSIGLEMPMGKGKGEVEIYAARVKKGQIVYEISGVDAPTAQKILTKAGKKLPIKTRVVEKGEIR